VARAKSSRKKKTKRAPFAPPDPAIGRRDDDTPPDETPLALRHLRRFGGALLVALLVPYFLPALEGLRAWVPGEDLPFANHFGRQPTDTPAFAGAGYQSAGVAESRERLRETLGEAVASNLLERTPSIERSGPRTRLAIEPYELEGITRHIEDPTGRGLAPFHAALARTFRGERDAVTRIAHYGDSSIATDLITHTVRRRLQHRFGDGGHGFVLVASGHLPYRHRDVVARDNGSFTVREVTRGGVEDGRYGYGGNQILVRAGARAVFAPDPDGPVGREVERFEIWYQRQKRGGKFRYRVDDGELVTVDTAAATSEDAVEVIDVPRGVHELELRHAGGRVHLYGVVLELGGPAVVYDSLGLVGARASRLLNFDREHFRAQLERRGVDLVVLGFGGNEASDRISGERYEEQMREVIRHVRGDRDDLGCLVVAPLDQGEVDPRGRIRTMPALPGIVEGQRRAAFAEGCAFFDTFAAMGGEGSMRSWSRSRPRLALSDYRHATPAGYEIIGNMLYKALLARFAEAVQAPSGDATAPAPTQEPSSAAQ
jgi:lysophospholipase L1-like esterase